MHEVVPPLGDRGAKAREVLGGFHFDAAVEEPAQVGGERGKALEGLRGGPARKYAQDELASQRDRRRQGKAGGCNQDSKRAGGEHVESLGDSTARPVPAPRLPARSGGPRLGGEEFHDEALGGEGENAEPQD